MRLIGVLDLIAGQAVHARAGRREHYTPVRDPAGTTIEDGDALALARAYVNGWRLHELYVADLDAILGKRPQDALVAALAALDAPIWLDAGVTSIEQTSGAIALGAARIVVGLETLTSYGALRDICRAVGGDRVAFSIDLRDGRPLVTPGSALRAEPPARLATRAVDAGAGSLIVIDLGRVGTSTGLDLETIARVIEAAPGLAVLAGGGIRGFDDIAQLAGIGCDGVLVATALHEGRLSAADVAAAQRLGPRQRNGLGA